jgi:hypothetical protein
MKPLVVYYESRTRELKIRLMNEGRCYERLNETGFVLGPGPNQIPFKTEVLFMYTTHIHWVVRGTGTPKDKDEVNRRDVKIKTRLIDEMFSSVMGEYVFLK